MIKKQVYSCAWQICPSTKYVTKYVNNKIIGVNAFLCYFIQMTTP